MNEVKVQWWVFIIHWSKKLLHWPHSIHDESQGARC